MMTVTLESGVVTIFSNVSLWFASASKATHIHDNLSSSIVLTIVLCSITPAVNTITSTHPKIPAYAHIYFTRALMYISKASTHFGSHCCTQATIALISLDTQEIQSNQLRLLRSSSICSAVLFSWTIRYVIIAGSIFPDLVPIISPSNGVIPIEVSTTFQPLIAVILAQFPI